MTTKRVPFSTHFRFFVTPTNNMWRTDEKKCEKRTHSVVKISLKHKILFWSLFLYLSLFSRFIPLSGPISSLGYPVVSDSSAITLNQRKLNRHHVSITKMKNADDGLIVNLISISLRFVRIKPFLNYIFGHWGSHSKYEWC